MDRKLFDAYIRGAKELWTKEEALMAILKRNEVTTLCLSPEFAEVFDIAFSQAYGEAGCELATWWLYEVIPEKTADEITINVGDVASEFPVIVDGLEYIITNVDALYSLLEEKYGTKQSQ